jgi:hypothetical protein
MVGVGVFGGMFLVIIFVTRQVHCHNILILVLSSMLPLEGVDCSAALLERAGLVGIMKEEGTSS